MFLAAPVVIKVEFLSSLNQLQGISENVKSLQKLLPSVKILQIVKVNVSFSFSNLKFVSSFLLVARLISFVSNVK